MLQLQDQLIALVRHVPNINSIFGLLYTHLSLQAPVGLQVTQHVAPMLHVRENLKIASVMHSVTSFKTAAMMPLRYVLQLV